MNKIVINLYNKLLIVQYYLDKPRYFASLLVLAVIMKLLKPYILGI